MNNRVIKVLNTRYPLIQAPLYFLTNAELDAAVSNAGGLGTLGPHAGQESLPGSRYVALDRMWEEIRTVKKLTNNPFAAVPYAAGLLPYIAHRSEPDAGRVRCAGHRS